MIEVYSENITVNANATIPLNTVALLKGASTQLQGTGTIQLNKCGIYEVKVFTIITGATTNELSIQLQKNGILVPQAMAAVTVSDTNSLNTIGFTTLVQVPENNKCNCPCSIPTTISVINTGEQATINLINVKVTRI